jgi:hypothetical protein
VQDADEAVGQASQGVVVADSASSQAVVVRAGTRGYAQCGERLLKQCVSEAFIAGLAG